MDIESRSFFDKTEKQAQITVGSVDEAIREVRRSGPLSIYINDEGLSDTDPTPTERVTERLRGITRLPSSLWRK
ncbi:MAG: hypothetical protein AAB478_00305 [Patescibacteria group bacterium]